MAQVQPEQDSEQTNLGLCEHCSPFLSDLIDHRMCPTSPSWIVGAKGVFIYRHHENLDSLLASAQRGCSLCTVIAKPATNRKDAQRQIGLLSETQPSRGKPFLIGFKVGWLDGVYFNYDTVFDEPRDFQLYTTRPWYPPPIEQATALPDVALFARALELDPASETSFDVARAWLNHCEAAHTACARGDGELPQLPTRVMDVGPEDGSQGPYLLITEGMKGEYVALSHCWGGKLSMETRRETLAARCHGIPFADLPPTFQDAVVATRKLGLRYLWIDALCIIQGDAADWAAEAATMGSVYEHARVTISALDATSSKTGLFRRRAPPRMTPIGPLPHARANAEEILLRELPQRFGVVLEERSPLNLRGWVLQERVLAPRILHFSGDQLFWECRTRFYAEDGMSEPVHPVLKGLHEYLSEFFGAETLDADPCLLWYGLVEEYTLRALTFGSDKLPAVAGMAGITFQRLTGERYCAGLWAEDLHRGLLWHANTFHGLTARCTPSDLRRPNDGRSPSWSWASVDGKVTWDFLLKQGLERAPTPYDCEVVVAEEKVGFLGEGKAPWAGVDVRLSCVGRVRPVTYIPKPFTGDGKWSGRLEEIEGTTFVHMDDARDEQRNCVILFMSSWHWTTDHYRFFKERNPRGPIYFSYYLLLERVDGGDEGKQVFRRVGFAKTFHEKRDITADYGWITLEKQVFSII